MTREVFQYSNDESRRDWANRPRVCFGCGRTIRDGETGWFATDLCEDCQVEAEEQAQQDNDACQAFYTTTDEEQ